MANRTINFFQRLRAALMKASGTENTVLRVRAVQTDGKRYNPVNHGVSMKKLDESPYMVNLLKPHPTENNAFELLIDADTLIESLEDAGLYDTVAANFRVSGNDLVYDRVKPDGTIIQAGVTISGLFSAESDTLYGSGIPDNGIGNDGDEYLDTTSGIIYQKESGVWVVKKDLNTLDNQIASEVPFDPTGTAFDTGSTDVDKALKEADQKISALGDFDQTVTSNLNTIDSRLDDEETKSADFESRIFNIEESSLVSLGDVQDMIDASSTYIASNETTFIRKLIVAQQADVQSFYDKLIKVSHFLISLTKDISFDKANDFLYIRKMGLVDTGLPYNSTTNPPEVVMAWYDNSTTTSTDVCSFRFQSYLLNGSYVSRNNTLYGTYAAKYKGIELNSSGILGSFLSTKADLFDFLKTNTYEITDVANVKFVVPNTCVLFEYESLDIIREELGADGKVLTTFDVGKGYQRLPKFYEHWISRDTNLNIIVVGDSLMARDSHTTYFSATDQQQRPPLLISKNVPSYIYDHLSWNNAKYARYDSAFFAESGATFVTVTTNSGDTASNGINSTQWDDFATRPSHTRMYNGTALCEIQFTIPANTYICNFIYRTDLNGSDSNVITITEGNGNVEVWNGSAWVEANGFDFSMKHPATSAHRGNTKFQERLKFRMSDLYKGGLFDSRSTAKTITITKNTTASSRFMYWGVEYSEDPFVVRLINAARGSQSTATMLPFLDDDVFDWVNEPDSFSLVIHEIYINQGVDTFNSTKTIQQFKDEWEDYFFASSNAYSYREQSKSINYWDKFEAIVFNTHPTVYGGGIKTIYPYGFNSWDNLTDGTKTIAQNYNAYDSQYRQSYDEDGVIFINMFLRVIAEAKKRYGYEWYKAFNSSSVSGYTFLNDGTHLNDYGATIYSGTINKIFN